MGHKNTSRTAPNKLKAAEARAQALELRQAGWSYPKIAQHIGRSVTQAFHYVSDAMDQLAEKSQEHAEKVRDMELLRLDRLFAGVYPQAITGQAAAIDRCIKIMERRARLLGLDAPVKMAHTDPSGEEERDPATYIVPVPAQIGLDEWLTQYANKATSSNPSE